MGYRYAVLGSGRQGTAAAYDLATRGEADSVVFGDVNLNRARAAAKRVNRLLGSSAAKGVRVDVTKRESAIRALSGVDVFVSAVPYYLNLDLARAAVRAKASMVDLGGHTDLVRRELALDARARKAGIAIVPACGLGPGCNVTLAVYAMGLLDEPAEVRVYDAGLPQQPTPPWDYELTFNVEGLSREYTGTATFLRDGKLVEVPALTEPEDIVVPPLGKMEALVTSGGLATMPWTFDGTLRVLENKTLRYPGHWTRIRAFADLGLLSDKPVTVRGKKVVPREVFQTLFEPRISPKDIRDVAVIRVVALGRKGGRPVEAVVDLFDWYDEDTGFRAMERVTGWHAAIVAGMIARGDIPAGAHPVERGVQSGKFVEEARRRGLSITDRVG